MESTIEVPQLILPDESGTYKVLVFERTDIPFGEHSLYLRFKYPSPWVYHSSIFQSFADELGVMTRLDDHPSDVSRTMFVEGFTQYKLRSAGSCRLNLPRQMEPIGARFYEYSRGYPDERFKLEDKNLLEKLLGLPVVMRV